MERQDRKASVDFCCRWRGVGFDCMISEDVSILPRLKRPKIWLTKHGQEEDLSGGFLRCISQISDETLAALDECGRTSRAGCTEVLVDLRVVWDVVYYSRVCVNAVVQACDDRWTEHVRKFLVKAVATNKIVNAEATQDKPGALRGMKNFARKA